MRRAAAVVGAVATVAHLVSMRAGWVLDDWELFVENPYMRSASGLPTLLTCEMFLASGDARVVPYYRPLSSLVYWLTYQLFGLNTFAQHFLNVLLHATVAVLVYVLLRRLAVGERAALLLGIVFAAHPITAEQVAYFGGRQDVHGWCFVLGAALALTKPKRPPFAFAIAFAGTLAAVFSREFFFTAPAFLAVVATVPGTDGRTRARAGSIAGAGSSTALLVALVLRKVLGIVPFHSEPVGVSEKLGAAAAVFTRLTKDVVAPTDIAMNTTLRPLSPGVAAGILVGAFALALLGARALAKRKEAIACYGFGVAIFGAVVLLHTAVALRDAIVSDRYAYGVLLALVFIVAPFLSAPLERAKLLAKPTIAIGAAAALVLGLAPLTWARAADYASDQTLQSAMVRERPDDPQSWLAQAALLRAEGRKEEAYAFCIRYAEACPTSTTADGCVAEEALSRKDYKRAAFYLERWVFKNPADTAARATYFDALFRIGDLPRIKHALDVFERADPDAPDVKAAREAYDRATATTPR